MNEISNRLCIIPANKVSVYPNLITSAPSGSSTFACVKKINISQKPSADEQGVKWQITVSATTLDKRAMALDGSRAYLGIFISDGKISVTGTPSLAPLISVTPEGSGRFMISSSFESYSPYTL